MPIQSAKLKSSWLDEAVYDDQTQTLTVTTKSGTKHEHQVPPHMFTELLASPSPGQFYNAKLRK
jgi:KTSC domain